MSLLKDVANPVIINEDVVEEIVPVLDVVGQAVALQFPVERLEIVAALIVTPIDSRNMVNAVFTLLSLTICLVNLITYNKY
jgi:hypothetical protein